VSHVTHMNESKTAPSPPIFSSPHLIRFFRIENRAVLMDSRARFVKLRLSPLFGVYTVGECVRGKRERGKEKVKDNEKGERESARERKRASKRKREREKTCVRVCVRV